jgi:hypothetical protein
MALLEDLGAFLADFGVPCVAGASQFLALLDQPDEILDLGHASAHSRQYLITYRTSDATLTRGATVAVNSVAYTVREAPRQVDDGAFSRCLLSKT